MKIKGKLSGEIENGKRFYLPGLTVTQTCVKCGAKEDWSDTFYLSYPRMNEKFSVPCYCSVCQHEWHEDVILKVTLQQV
jgi:hypothetical protein